MTRHCMKYTGPSATISGALRMLHEEGLTVVELPRQEFPQTGEDPDPLAQCIVCTGAEAALEACELRFRDSPLGQISTLTVCR